MLGQVFSFPSRPWLSALPLRVPSHPPVPGPARSPTFVISWGHHSLVLCRACRRSILCGMCLIVEKPESDSPWKQPGLMFFEVPGPSPSNGAALPLQRGGLCEAHRMLYRARERASPRGPPRIHWKGP